MEKQTGIWQKFKEDMKEANFKTAAKHRENVNQSKAQIKTINAETKASFAAIEKPTGKVSWTRKLMALWLLIFTAPLLLFAVVLFIAGVLLFWDAIFGL